MEQTQNKNILLSVENLRVYFPIYGGVFIKKVGEVKAVDGVSFSIKEGETLGLVGESGCGKSTIGKSIVRLVEPTQGKILFRKKEGQTVDLVGLNRKEMRPYRADIQMIFQDPYSSLNPRFTIGRIIEEPLEIHCPEMKKEERHARVKMLLNKVGLNEEQAARYPHEFSGGQRQRVGIARALSTHPKLIIADEPVSALDVSIQAQVINLLQDLQKEFGLTILFVAHNLAVVEHISSRIVVMYLGNIVEIGQSQEIYHHPKHPYSRALLSAVPLPDPDLKDQKKKMILKGEIPSPLAKPSGCAFRTRCPIAKPECAQSIPPLDDTGQGHLVACPYWKEMV
ncbi:MAG: ATP-binding cassette domain-containing protein [Candidatus Brocadiae bacterium]|nr:ATP-binding cassette domain-containing protein [Candidatus Brocadiia bacterium]